MNDKNFHSRMDGDYWDYEDAITREKLELLSWEDNDGYVPPERKVPRGEFE